MSYQATSTLKGEREPLIVSLDGRDDFPSETEILRTLRDESDPGASSLAYMLGLGCFPLTMLGSWFSLEPQQQAVILSYGKYSETIRDPGLHFSNCWGRTTRKIDTKVIAMDLKKVTVIDSNANPLIISAVVAFHVVSAKRALLDVSNVYVYVQSQSEATLKAVVSRYPYESNDGSPCLKTEATQIGRQLCQFLQQKVLIAGVFIDSFQLKEISYAPEIAGVMLRRQQAVALIDARNTIVEGAVQICCNAVEKLRKRNIELTESEQARIVGNLLAVICSDHDAQPTVPLMQ